MHLKQCCYINCTSIKLGGEKEREKKIEANIYI